jgi:hypothetical protein
MNKAENYVATNPPGVLVEGGTEKGHEKTVDVAEACSRFRSSVRSM